MVYYLVSLAEDKDMTHRPFFWMKDYGDRWENFVKGQYPFKDASDIISERVDADEKTELDWSKTPLYDSDSKSGWLSRDGTFYGCPGYYHDKFAAYVFGIKVEKLEKTGWARILGCNSYSSTRRLSRDQNRWLRRNSYKVNDD